MMAELFGKVTGYCKGKGGSMHIADFSIGILGANGIVGGGLPLICGGGLSHQAARDRPGGGGLLRRRGLQPRPFHEAMNMASIWKLPVIFVCENNQWASTTPRASPARSAIVAERAAGYGMPGASVDGNDVLAVRARRSRPWPRPARAKGRA